jgi:hypothetical protein
MPAAARNRSQEGADLAESNARFLRKPIAVSGYTAVCTQPLQGLRDPTNQRGVYWTDDGF